MKPSTVFLKNIWEISLISLTSVFAVLLFPQTTIAIDTSYTYTSQEQDKSGLMYYDSRYYDPDLGRFLQPDSYDVPNKYAYVSNDPVNKTDPSGHIDQGLDFFARDYVLNNINTINNFDFNALSSAYASTDSIFTVGDMVGPWGNPNSNLYLDAADDIAKEQNYYQHNDARFLISYEDYKMKNYPLYADTSLGVNPVGIALGNTEKLLAKAGLSRLVEKELLAERQALELIEKSWTRYTGKIYSGDDCIASACRVLTNERKGVGSIIYSQNHAFVSSVAENGAIRIFDTKPYLSFKPFVTNSNLRFFQKGVMEDAKSLYGASIEDYFFLKLEKQRWMYNDYKLKTFGYFFLE